MTALDPAIHAYDPLGRTDHLGSALQQGLPRPMNPKLTWGLIRTFILSGLSGGILPLLVLPKRFYNFATAEQLQFWHLAEWLRLQTGVPEASSASEAARRAAPGSVMRVASVVFAMVAIGIGWNAVEHQPQPVPMWFALTMPQLNQHQLRAPRLQIQHRQTPQEMWQNYYRSDGSETFATPAAPVFWSTPRQVPRAPIDLVHAFALAMTGAGLCWLIQINGHIARSRRFVFAFNRLSNRFGVGEVRPPSLHLGLRPLWMLGAAAMWFVGAYWSVPVLLAAAAHRRYIRTTSLRLRSDLARRQREVLLRQRPAQPVPSSVYLMDHCPQPTCRAPLPPEAKFCRRCGTTISGRNLKD